MLAAFGFLALSIGWWTLSGVSARDDNPRRIFTEQHSPRGAIVDRNGDVLAVSSPISATYVRRYPLPEAAPVVGYYSLNYGLSGVEEAADAVLRGPLDPIDQLLHRTPSGRTVRTTLDPITQRDLAARFTQPGGAIILSIPDGAVLALASYPTFDPNTLDQNWKQLSVDPSAPLLNRVTQGLYQPGAILETLLLADALEQHTAALTETVERPDAPVALDNLIVDCAHAGPMTTLADAYANACPAPFADLGVRLGETELISLTQRWQLDQPPPLETAHQRRRHTNHFIEHDAGFASLCGRSIVAYAITAANGARRRDHRQSRGAAHRARHQRCDVDRGRMDIVDDRHPCQRAAPALARHRPIDPRGNADPRRHRRAWRCGLQWG